MTLAAAAHSNLGFQAVHHFGISVSDLGRSVRFWELLIGTKSRDRSVLDGPQLGTLVGYPGIRVESCWVDLPGGVSIELVKYLDTEEGPNPPGTAHPGNVHVCLRVDDMAKAHDHALACGAEPVSPGFIEVPAGERAGTRLAYLRAPDAVTIELVQIPEKPRGQRP